MNKLPTTDYTDSLIGVEQIIYVDECGRGCLAGPVLACAVMLPLHGLDLGINQKFIRDSKLLSRMRRNKMYKILTSHVRFAIGIVDASEIDELNIQNATLKAMELAVAQFPTAGFVLVDGDVMPNFGNIPTITIIGGDRKEVGIAVASIIGKETRDQLMKHYAKQYPNWEFEYNFGYGTPNHCLKLKTQKPTPLHRYSFNPLRTLTARAELHE